MSATYSDPSTGRASPGYRGRRRRSAARSPLGVPAFRALFAGRVSASLATSAAPLLLAFAVLDISGSASTLGLLLAARSAPQVLLLLAGGVVADRLPRRHVMLVATVVSAVTQGAVAALLLTGST